MCRSKTVSHFSLNTCSVLNRDYLAGRSWLSSLFLRSQVAERGPHVCTGTAAVPRGRCYLQLNPLMLLITHHTVCLCVCVYLSMHTTREHIGTLRRCSWCTVSHAIMPPKKEKKNPDWDSSGFARCKSPSWKCSFMRNSRDNQTRDFLIWLLDIILW